MSPVVQEQPAVAGTTGLLPNHGPSHLRQVSPLAVLVLLVYGELKPRADAGEGASANVVAGLVDEIEGVLGTREGHRA